MSRSATPLARSLADSGADRVTPTRTWRITFTLEPGRRTSFPGREQVIHTTAFEHVAIIAQIIDQVRPVIRASLGDPGSVCVDPATGWGEVYDAGHRVARLSVAEITSGTR